MRRGFLHALVFALPAIAVVVSALIYPPLEDSSWLSKVLAYLPAVLLAATSLLYWRVSAKYRAWLDDYFAKHPRSGAANDIFFALLAAGFLTLFGWIFVDPIPYGLFGNEDRIFHLGRVVREIGSVLSVSGLVLLGVQAFYIAWSVKKKRRQARRRFQRGRSKCTPEGAWSGDASRHKKIGLREEADEVSGEKCTSNEGR